MFEKVKDMARDDRRSINAEIIEVIDRALKLRDLRLQRQEALTNLSRIRRSQPPSEPGVNDGVTLLREDRER